MINETTDKAKAASKTMDDVKGRLQGDEQLGDEQMKKATTQAAKDEIKKRQKELKR